MVWALEMPSAFGEFVPRGDFRGYEELLYAYFNAEHPLDGDGVPYRAATSYKREVSEKFHSELGVRRTHYPPLGQIQPHEWPAEYVYDKVYKRRAAIIGLPNRLRAVEDGFREVIERLEPGVHQFRPIRLVLPKGVDHPIQHHMMVVGRYLSSFRLDQSDPACLRNVHESGWAAVYGSEKQYYAGVAMAQSDIGSAHFWHERNLGGPDFCVSDLLMEEVGKAGLRLPAHFRMKSV